MRPETRERLTRLRAVELGIVRLGIQMAEFRNTDDDIYQSVRSEWKYLRRCHAKLRKMLPATLGIYPSGPPWPPLVSGTYCKDCHERCRPQRMDFGIGAYEYWGARGNDVNIQTVSDCCEAEVVDQDLKPYEGED